MRLLDLAIYGIGAGVRWAFSHDVEFFFGTFVLYLITISVMHNV